MGALPASLRVVEFGGGAASYTTHFLADLGSTVIKVEPPGGDPDRAQPPFGNTRLRPGLSAHWIFFNANKQSVVLDLSRQADLIAFRALVGSADVLVDASGPDTLRALGCSYDDLLTSDPELVVLAQTPFGLSGPRRGYWGDGLVAEAMSGFLYPLGDRMHLPIPSPNEFQLQVAGLHGASYVIAARRHVERSGRGQLIDMSLQEVGTHMTPGGVLAYGLSHAITRRPRLGYAVAMQMHLPLKDGYVIVQPVFPAMWKAFIDWVGNPELDKPEYATADARLNYLEEIEQIVVPFAAQFSVAEFVAEAQQRRIPSSPINPPAALLDSPQVQALGSLVTMQHPALGEFQAMGYPVRLSATPMAFRSAAPELGQHQHSAFADALPSMPAARASAQPATGGPLDGIRVLDFTHVLAGPTATQVLAFLGAEVIKVEIQGADGEKRAPNFVGLNRGKKSITLDARTPDGYQLALKLAQSSDVVIDNFSAGVMARMKLAYDDLRSVKPDIIAVSINGWGRGGPLSNWSAYGPTLQAYTGMYWTWRHPSAAVHQGVKSPPADYLCAAQALLGILAAISHRERTGEGQFVELVMLEGLAHSLGPYYLGADVARGSRDAPHGCYPCAGEDAWCVIACDNDKHWQGLGRALGQPAWTADARFGTREQRLAAAAELDRYVAEWTSTLPSMEVMRILQAQGVPAGAVQTAEDVFNDPHLRARGHLVSTPNPAGGEPLVVEGMTAHFSLSECHDDTAAPQLGQHNQEVLGSLAPTPA